MAKDFLYPGSILSLHRKAADKLLSSGSGDAALLYLAFLAGRDGRTLGWESERLEAAHGRLLELGLADPQKPAAAPPEKKLEDSSPPVYTTQDIKDTLERDSAFAGLVPEVEKRLGRSLVTQDVKDLMYLTDYLGLPPEVVLMLAGHCVDRAGPGARVTLNQIKREGLQWHDAGAVTLEAADAYMARQALRRDRYRTLLALLDRPGRDPMKQERTYLDQWMEQGFRDEVIREAYERTVFQVGELRWGYMNGILRSWNLQGLYTIEDVQAAEQKRKHPLPSSRSKDRSETAAPVDPGDIDWILAEEAVRKEG